MLVEADQAGMLAVADVLSSVDGHLYTAAQEGLLGDADPFEFAAIDADTGRITDRALFGSVLANPLQMAGTELGGAYFQGTITGVARNGRA